ncbi:MAG: hypothetical protein N2Z81_05440 [Hydrogenothermaceae bacterium]|nr:hypothetical protein [Hydrogenothermaceae bacterium]
METKTSKNIPFIVITGFGIIATLFFIYFFVYNKAVDTVRKDLVIQKAYPKIKPQEFITELIFIASKSGFSISQIYTDNRTFLVNIYSQKEIDQVINLNPNALAYINVGLVIYDLGDGTAVVGNNPYIWDIIFEDKNLDERAQEYSQTVSNLLDNVYLSIREKKKSI